MYAVNGGMAAKWKIDLSKHTSCLILNTRRGGGELGPPVSQSGSLCLRTCSVCLSASVPAGFDVLHLLSGTGAVCPVSHLLCVTCRLPLSRGTMMHLSSSSATKSAQLAPR